MGSASAPSLLLVLFLPQGRVFSPVPTTDYRGAPCISGSPICAAQHLGARLWRLGLRRWGGGQTDANGVACILAMGEAWEAVVPPLA